MEKILKLLVGLISLVMTIAWLRIMIAPMGLAVAEEAGLPALLVENFTKTVFDFNLGGFTSPVRYLYAVGWLLVAGVPRLQARPRAALLGVLLLLLAGQTSAQSVPSRISSSLQRTLELSGLSRWGHGGKALIHILNTYPRDELFQITEGQLTRIAMDWLTTSLKFGQKHLRSAATSYQQ